MIEAKKALTPEEIIMVAHGALTYGLAQHHLAGLYGVDSGRIAEAVVAMRWAAENHRLIYKHVQKLKGNGRRKKEPLANPAQLHVREEEILRLALQPSDPLHPSNRGFDGPGGAE